MSARSLPNWETRVLKGANMTSGRIVARAEMLIRRPVSEVFEAFVDPAITSRFWFSRGSARLEAGQSVRWDWEMYGFSADATVKALEPNRSILVEWSAYGVPTDIEWVFSARADGTTFVSITNSGFSGSPHEAGGRRHGGLFVRARRRESAARA
jgi:uncharacterized protein YndB with AHSA1/START domain